MTLDDGAHVARLNRLVSPEFIAALGNALLEGAETIAEDAIFSIRDGAISGSGHIASLPGDPPNADTHDLDESIHVGELIETPSQIQTAVIADSGHALYMELGTSRIAPRPFLSPAMQANRPTVLRRVAQAASAFLGRK